ncbi:DUF4112 domain-containing protein [Halobellus sp. GM3]|uniref:DUF4112 domain-containing protein n=1 Tax=Halobellus sp. GM3 TaxID=3458410 RepID=UPI00403D5D3F
MEPPDEPVEGAPPTTSDVAGPPNAPRTAASERLARLRRESRLLDSAVEIPVLNVRVGLDPLLGLLPGVGDVTATAASAYIVAEAAALGAPRATLARMCLNLLVDALLGSVPLVGDAFDVVWRANDRNVRLLEARTADPSGEQRDRRVVLALGVGVFAVVFAASVGALAVAWWLLGASGVV